MARCSEYSNVFDRLKLERINPDGNKYFQGEKGRYLFKYEKSATNPKRIGCVILNRRFLTGLFVPKHSEKYRTYLGDDKDKFLIFQETDREKISVYWINKKKK